ncbi:MAG: response regulator transcription factor [bacterium]
MSIKVLLAEDHHIMRQGLRSLLEDQSNITVVGEAKDGRETIQLAGKFKPDVIVMDISMPNLNGMEATYQILEELPDVKIIGLSVHSDEQFISGMFRAGACGYLLKDCVIDELMNAIDTVVRDQIYISPSISKQVIKDYRQYLKKDKDSVFELLTEREREVLQLIAEGKSTKEIAGTLYVSEKTVATHRQNMMNKLDIYSVPELVKYAIKEGLISLK